MTAKRVVGRSGALAIAVVLLIATGVALAATHFAKRALYTGRSCRGDAGLPGATCVYKFRSSRDGLTLRFVGKTVIATWICQGGGGEALIGGTLQGATPVPVVKVRANGTVYGSASRAGNKVTVTGKLMHGGKTVVITFHQGQCVVPRVTLNKR
ncbi:MAG TPA: hypothetical protein VFI54_08940 [Solirubrobacteraceae bacterium]|nr:hypothetical protein [Solirubrobacteraceae bacterium]